MTNAHRRGRSHGKKVARILTLSSIVAGFPVSSPADTTLEVGDAQVVAGQDGSVSLPFVIARDGDTTDGVRIQVETRTGGANPAEPDEDFTPLPAGTEVVLQPGETSTTVDVEVFGPVVGDDRTLLLHIAGASAFNATPRFRSAALNYPIAGSFPSSLAVSDLNGDGAADLVTGNDLSLSLSVLLSDGEGGYRPVSAQFIDDPLALLYSVSIAVGDVTGDGEADILATGFNTDAIRVFAGDGRGGFSAADSILLDSADVPTDIRLVDLDTDGDADIILPIGFTSEVMVLLGDGRGGFPDRRVFPAGQGSTTVAVADVTGDGNLDIVTANEVDGDASLLAGNGGGGFAAAEPVSLGPDAMPVSVTAADVDGDGNADIVTANRFAPQFTDPGSVSIVAGDGKGGFAEPVQIVLGERGGDAGFDPPGHVAVGQVVGDGSPDIVVSLPVSNVVAVFAGDGAGGFAEATAVPVADGPLPVAIADVTGNGVADIITGNASDGSVSVLPGDGGGHVGLGRDFGAGAYPHSIVSADLNGDGRPDVATANLASDDVSVLLNDGEGGFAGSLDLDVGGSPGGVTAGDLDGDGTVDLVSANLSGTISVLFGDGAGGFADAIDIGAGPLQNPYAVATGDVDGDGSLDIVSANATVETEGISLFLGDGSGGFAEPVVFDVGAAAFHDPRSIALADATGDGNLDILTANSVSSDLSLLVGDGAGGFAAAVSLPAGQGPVVAVVAEVTGDQAPDVIALNHTAQSVSILAGDGSGGFADAAEFPIFSQPETPCTIDPLASCPWAWGMVVADVNNDGDLDIVTANTDADTVSVLPNGGGGDFSSFQHFHTGAHPGSLAVADIDGDGNPDIVTANRQNDNVTVLASELSRVEIEGAEALGTIVADEEGAPGDGDGCGCAARGGGASGLAPFLLALFLVLRPRKRSRG